MNSIRLCIKNCVPSWPFHKELANLDPGEGGGVGGWGGEQLSGFSYAKVVAVALLFYVHGKHLRSYGHVGTVS